MSFRRSRLTKFVKDIKVLLENGVFVIIRYWREPVATRSALPLEGNDCGDARVVLDEDAIYVWDCDTNQWLKAVAPNTFTGLDDTPPNYVGAAEQYLRVKATEDGVEFTRELKGLPVIVTDGTRVYKWDIDPVTGDLVLSDLILNQELFRFSAATGEIIAGSKLNMNGNPLVSAQYLHAEPALTEPDATVFPTIWFQQGLGKWKTRLSDAVLETLATEEWALEMLQLKRAWFATSWAEVADAATLATAEKRGGIIFLHGDYTYTADQTVAIPPNVSIIGLFSRKTNSYPKIVAGVSPVFQHYTWTVGAVQINRAQNVVLANLVIDGQGLQTQAINFTGVEDVKLINLEVYGFTSTPITIGSGNGLDLIKVESHDNAGYGFTVGGVSNLKIAKCATYNNSGGGFRINNPSVFRIHGNLVYSNGGHGMEIRGVYMGRVTGNYVDGNGTNNPGVLAGIYISSGIGVGTPPPSWYVVVSGNFVGDTQATPTQGYGIQEVDGDYNVIMGNILMGNTVQHILTSGLATLVGPNVEV